MEEFCKAKRNVIKHGGHIHVFSSVLQFPTWWTRLESLAKKKYGVDNKKEKKYWLRRRRCLRWNTRRYSILRMLDIIIRSRQAIDWIIQASGNKLLFCRTSCSIWIRTLARRTRSTWQGIFLRTSRAQNGGWDWIWTTCRHSFLLTVRLLVVFLKKSAIRHNTLGKVCFLAVQWRREWRWSSNTRHLCTLICVDRRSWRRRT